MAVSTWWNITHGMPEAVHKGYMSKDAHQRNKREVADVWENFGSFCADIQAELSAGIYRIGEYRHFTLRDKKKYRDISVLHFRDRCVQNDVKDAIEPLILRYMTDDMMGGLPQRGVLSNTPRWSVVRRMQRIMADWSLTYYIQADVRKFYDSVDNVTAMRLIEHMVTDHRTLSVIRQHLFKQKRLAIGDPFSHLIANMVMSSVVRRLKARFGGKISIVNFSDDVFIASGSKDLLSDVRREMRNAADDNRLHYKRIYIRKIDDAPVVFCGMKYTRDAVYLSQRTKKRYVCARHRRLSMGSYNGILDKCDARYLRYLVEQNDNRHMADKIRRPFAGLKKTVEALEGITHTIIRVEERDSRRRDSDKYLHVQAIAEGLGLIVYTTSSRQMVQYLKENTVPMRDLTIAHDYSGYYYDGTVYTDAEEEEMLRKQFGIPRK